jgi:hypothetical protein
LHARRLEWALTMGIRILERNGSNQKAAATYN